MRERQLLDHREPVAGVERDVALLRRLQVGRPPFGVAVVQDGAHQRRSDAAALGLGIGPEGGEIPVGLVRMVRFDEADHLQRGLRVRPDVGEDPEQVGQAGDPGEQWFAGRAPDGRAKVVVGGVAPAERQVVAAHLAGEVGPHGLRAATLVAEDVGHHRVVGEGAAQLGRHGLDVGRGGLADRHPADRAAGRDRGHRRRTRRCASACHDDVDAGRCPARMPHLPGPRVTPCPGPSGPRADHRLDPGRSGTGTPGRHRPGSHTR